MAKQETGITQYLSGATTSLLKWPCCLHSVSASVKSYLLLLLIISSCTGAKSAQNAGPALVQESENSISPVYFLVFRISRNSATGESELQLIDTIKSEGKVKDTGHQQSHNAHQLRLEVYDKQRLVNAQTLEHPLYKHVEYVTESNNLAAKEVELTTADFFVRFQGPASVVKIYETINNAPARELKSFTL